jgi:hypothetical protein
MKSGEGWSWGGALGGAGRAVIKTKEEQTLSYNQMIKLSKILLKFENKFCKSKVQAMSSISFQIRIISNFYEEILEYWDFITRVMEKTVNQAWKIDFRFCFGI